MVKHFSTWCHILSASCFLSDSSKSMKILMIFNNSCRKWNNVEMAYLIVEQLELPSQKLLKWKWTYWYNSVDKSHFFCFSSSIEPAEKPHFSCFLRSYLLIEVQLPYLDWKCQTDIANEIHQLLTTWWLAEQTAEMKHQQNKRCISDYQTWHDRTSITSIEASNLTYFQV